MLRNRSFADSVHSANSARSYFTGKCICAFAAMFLFLSEPVSGWAQEKTATLTIKRLNQNGGSAWSWTVYVNGEKIGTIKSNTTKSLYFTPKSDGDNSIYVEGYTPIGENPKSKTLSFSVFSGGSVSSSVGFPTNDLYGYAASSYDTLDLEVKVTNKGTDPNATRLPAGAIPSNARVLSVKLDTKMKMVVVKESPPMRPARGTDRTIEDTVRIKHSVTIADGWKVEKEMKGKVTAVWLECEGGIKSGIEKSTNKTFGTETERKRSVILKGDGTARRVKVVWVDYFRTGVATISLNGRELDVPFEFREDFDLLTEDAE